MIEVNENEILEQAVSTVTKNLKKRVAEFKRNGLTEFMVVSDDYNMGHYMNWGWSVLCYDPSRVSDPEDLAAACFYLNSQKTLDDYYDKDGVEILVTGDDLDDMLKEYNNEDLGLEELDWEYTDEYGHGVNTLIQMINDVTGLNLTESDYYDNHSLVKRYDNGQVNDSKKTHTMRTRRIKDSTNYGDDMERFSEFLYQIEDDTEDSDTLFPMLVSVIDRGNKINVTFEALKSSAIPVETIMSCKVVKGSFKDMVADMVADMREQIDYIRTNGEQEAIDFVNMYNGELEDYLEENQFFIEVFTNLADYIEQIY